MPIVLCGLSHHTAPIELLERLAFSAEDRARARAQLTDPASGLAAEAVVLSTCNRVEIYLLSGHPTSDPGHLVSRFLAAFHDIPLPVLAPHLYVLEGEEAVRHLLSVTAGLDSLVIGEPQILGQVRDAFEEAQAAGTAGPALSALFRSAIQAGKRVHTETTISQRAASISQAGVELARREFGDLADHRVLVVGAGKTGQLVVRALAARGAHRVTVLNRTYERARVLAEEWGGQADTLERLPAALAVCEIAIVCTDAPEHVITPTLVAGALPARQGRPLLLIDLAMPRAVDPGVGNLPGVRLHNIEDLTLVAQVDKLRRVAGPQCPIDFESLGDHALQVLTDIQSDTAHAEVIVEEETAAFMAWLAARDVTPTIAELRAHAEGVRQEELGRALRRLDGLSAAQREAVEMLTRRIVNRLLHEPTVQLKRHAGRHEGHLYTRALRELFGL